MNTWTGNMFPPRMFSIWGLRDKFIRNLPHGAVDTTYSLMEQDDMVTRSMVRHLHHALKDEKGSSIHSNDWRGLQQSNVTIWNNHWYEGSGLTITYSFVCSILQFGNEFFYKSSQQQCFRFCAIQIWLLWFIHDAMLFLQISIALTTPRMFSVVGREVSAIVSYLDRSDTRLELFVRSRRRQSRWWIKRD